MYNPRPFYDTCTLLNLANRIPDVPFIISYVTLRELECIKTSAHKDSEIKAKARSVVRYLSEHHMQFKVSMNGRDECSQIGFEVTNDNIILSSAIFENAISRIDFYTDDLLLGLIARSRGLTTKTSKDIAFDDDEYLGYKEVTLNDLEMAYFYENLRDNPFCCKCNEYLIIKDKSGSVVDKRKWDGFEFVPLEYGAFKSRLLGSVKPLDEVQACAYDSICQNDITMLFGRAGSGKTTLPFSYIIHGLETQRIKKCNIIYHFEPLRNSRQLGFLPGNFNEKALGTASLGGVLASKAGDMSYIKSLIAEEKLQIIPTSSIRGVEFSKDEAVFVTECQNIDAYTLKTIVQRCQSGCKQFYEGDMLEQSDKDVGVGGMKRLLDVFKGNESFGCIKLKNNYRSKLCELADNM